MMVVFSADDLVADLRDPLPGVRYGSERARGQVEAAAGDVGSPIVHRHVDGLAVCEVPHPQPGAEGQRLVGCLHRPLVEGFTGCGGGVIVVERSQLRDRKSVV